MKYFSIFIHKAKLSRYVFVNELQSGTVFKNRPVLNSLTQATHAYDIITN